ncbi:hypothetical protein, partial [Caldibacillus debilis]|uniref:hypothetical protein n=1 Tax=Caldibacillus debilis TaxID=301148 RepID=UPI001F1C81EB
RGLSEGMCKKMALLFRNKVIIYTSVTPTSRSIGLNTSVPLNFVPSFFVKDPPYTFAFLPVILTPCGLFVPSHLIQRHYTYLLGLKKLLKTFKTAWH